MHARKTIDDKIRISILVFGISCHLSWSFSQFRNALLLQEQCKIHISSSKHGLSQNCNMVVFRVVQGSAWMIFAEKPSDSCIRSKYSWKILIIFENII